MKKLLLLLTLFPSITFSQTHYFPWTNGINITLNGSVAAVAGSDLALDANVDRIYYTGTDNKIHYYHKDVLGQNQESVLNSTASLANSETGIEFDALGNVFYIGQNGYLNKLDAANNWQHFPINSFLPSSPSYISARSDSRLVATFPGGYLKLHYIGVDYKVHYVEWSSAGGWITGLLSANSINARINSPIIKDPYNKIYYIGIDNKIHALYKDNGSWHDATLGGSVDASSDLIMDENDKLYFVGTDHKIHYMAYYHPNWLTGVLDNNSVVVNSDNQFTYNNGNIIYLGTDNKIYSTFYDKCKWKTIHLDGGMTSDQLTSARWNSGYYSSTYGKSYFFNAGGGLIVLEPKVDYTSDFVYLKDKKLRLKSNAFNVKGANYQIEMNQDNRLNSPTYQKYYLSRYSRYCQSGGFRCSDDPTIASSLIDTDFANMEANGINTVRIVGFGAYANSADMSDSKIYTRVTKENATTNTDCDGNTINVALNTSVIEMDDNYINTVYLPHLQVLLDKAEDYNLKVILLTGLDGANRLNVFDRYEVLLEKIATEFQGNSTLMAIDVFNEPADGHRLNLGALGGTMSKDIVCSLTQDMYDAIRNNNDNLLVTIGLWPNDAFLWDPEIVAADFISFHNYSCKANCETNFSAKMEELKRDYKYIQKYCSKAWIVGETGFSANPDPNSNVLSHGTVAQQNTFMEKSLEYSVTAGSTGLLWWAYHDDYTGYTYGSFYGLVSNQNDCKSPDIEVNKAVLDELADFNNYCNPIVIQQPSDLIYYNRDAVVTSDWIKYVYDVATNLPIENAISYAWDYSSSSNRPNKFTYSDANGYTNLTNMVVQVARITAPGYEAKTLSGYPASGGYVYLSKLNCSPNIYRKKTIRSEIDNLEEHFSATIFPNPLNGNKVYLKSENEAQAIQSVVIFDNLGKMIERIDVNNTQTELDLSNYSNGLYYFTIQHETGLIQKKLIIAH